MTIESFAADAQPADPAARLRPAPARRAVLLAGLAGLGAGLAGCAGHPAPTTSPVQRAGSALAALEQRFGGRLGVFAMDTGSGATLGYRAGERFLLCSTSKVFVVAAILRLRMSRAGLLEQVIHYLPDQVLSYAPITSRHVADGMTVSALCTAALTVSDNTAENLLLTLAGGPPAGTAYLRGIGDQITRLDRMEPDLNSTTPGDQRDTSTPTQVAQNLRVLLLGDALDPQGRDLLTAPMVASQTGLAQIRAAVPAGWRVADKTGSGNQGEANDIAVLWPPNRRPLLIAVYTAPTDPHSPAAIGHTTIAAAAGIALGALPG